VPEVGRTRKFCQVRLHGTLLALLLVTVKTNCVLVTVVIATDVPLDTPLMLFAELPEPLSRVTFTVGAVPPVSKIKPGTTFRTIVPVPTLPPVFSVYTGPLKLVNVPPVVSAEIALPPVAPAI
jgi:hypothetical protein